MARHHRNIVRNRLLASVAFSALLGGTALAQAPVTYVWTGLYVGGNVGYISSTSRAHENDEDSEFFATEASRSGSGVLGGAQLGYNWQLGPTVLGVEGDFDFSGTKASGTSGSSGEIFFGTSSQISHLGTIRGRVGYAFAPVPLLVYATAGIAYGDVKNSVNLPQFSSGNSSSSSDWRAGWTAGGGIEYAFLPNWTVRAEGLYVDLGGQQLTTGPSFAYRFGFRDTAVIGRTAINFKF